MLFADVVGSMDLAAVLDVERPREVMTGLVGRSAAVVCRRGATVEFIGDGAMALSGAPVALVRRICTALRLVCTYACETDHHRA